MPKTAVKSPTFDEYKSIKDEIIEISELRFENILNKKFDAFRRDFKKELMVELDAKFDAIDSKFDAIDSKIASVASTIETLKWSVWSLPVIMTVLMALFTLALKYLVKI